MQAIQSPKGNGQRWKIADFGALTFQKGEVLLDIQEKHHLIC